ncbi:MAG: hypothetical protein H7Y20_18870 [Bryobacteraceae bacterium]|nr:hypothetical protein [Bryobacteraceae bacterium]
MCSAVESTGVKAAKSSLVAQPSAGEPLAQGFLPDDDAVLMSLILGRQRRPEIAVFGLVNLMACFSVSTTAQPPYQFPYPALAHALPPGARCVIAAKDNLLFVPSFGYV